MAINYICKYQHFPLHGPPKFTQNWEFCFEKLPSGNPAYGKKLSHKVRNYHQAALQSSQRQHAKSLANGDMFKLIPSTYDSFKKVRGQNLQHQFAPGCKIGTLGVNLAPGVEL
jgi:hypothetical protein